MVEDDTNIQLEIPWEKEMKLRWNNEVEKEFWGLDFWEKMDSGVHEAVAALEDDAWREEEENHPY